MGCFCSSYPFCFSVVRFGSVLFMCFVVSVLGSGCLFLVFGSVHGLCSCSSSGFVCTVSLLVVDLVGVWFRLFCSSGGGWLLGVRGACCSGDGSGGGSLLWRRCWWCFVATVTYVLVVVAPTTVLVVLCCSGGGFSASV
jgi:hypothetical protein